jgi:macrolide transport system ATP-binding/permease protein
LINAPRLLVADEPTVNLDTRTSHEIIGLNRDQRLTIVVVTHETDIAAFADRVVTMRDRRIVADERKPKRQPTAASAPERYASFLAMGEARPATGGAAAFWAFGTMIAGAASQAIQRNLMRWP